MSNTLWMKLGVSMPGRKSLLRGCRPMVERLEDRLAPAASLVYHEQMNNFIDQGADVSNAEPDERPYVVNSDRSILAGFQVFDSEPYRLRYKIDDVNSTDRVRIYYTIDGSNPSGAFGTPTGSTQVVDAAFRAVFQVGSQFTDIAGGTIPAQAAGTTVKYIVSAWDTSGGAEIFGNGSTFDASNEATVFSYQVISSKNVAVFDNSTYVDTDGTSGAESDNVQASLTALGHTVTTFTGITASAISTALAGKDVLAIPEQQYRLLAQDLDAAAKAAIQNFVASGGGVIVWGQSTVAPFGGSDFLNAVFGFAVSENIDPGTTTRTAGATGTEFADDPATIPQNTSTDYLASDSLPIESISIYQNGTKSSVALMPFGNGYAAFLGWDWFSSNPPTAGGEDGGWQQVLDSAVRELAKNHSGTVTGTKFHDINGNGQQDTGEDGLQGWTIFADLNNDGDRDLAEPFALTDANGNYSLKVRSGTRTIREEPQAGWVQTAPDGDTHSVSVVVGQTVSGKDFGNNAIPSADAGGDYQVDEGGSVQLDGTSSIDPSGGSIVTYEWDFDYDGATFDVDATGATVNFSAASLAGPTSRTVALRVIDSGGLVSTIDTATVSVNNLPPTADAAGPYEVDEGSSIQFDGAASADFGSGSVVTWEWDFDYDGVTFNVDATGSNPTFNAAGLSGPASRTIGLRVIDDDGATSPVVTTTLDVKNIAPTVGISLPAQVRAGKAFRLSALASDIDAVTFQWRITGPNGFVRTIDAAGARLILKKIGTYQAKVTVTDADGLSTTRSGNILVKSAPAARLVLVQGPMNMAAFQQLRPVIVQLVDAYGNPVRKAGVVIRVWVQDGPRLVSVTAHTNAQGRARLTGITLYVPGTRRLTIQSAGLPPLLSNSFVVTRP